MSDATYVNADLEVPDIEIDTTMIGQVTVVPPDRIMLINGVPLHFDYPYPERMHALQWNQKEKRGHIEAYTDFGTMENIPLEEKDYADKVLPYIRLYAQEQARQWAEAMSLYHQEVENYDSEDARMSRLKLMKDDILQKTDYLVLPDVAMEFAPNILQLIYKYRKMVREIAKQDGAPWDGGGPKTPWPKPPIEVLKKQERKTEPLIQQLQIMAPDKPVFTGVPLDRQSYEIYKQYGESK